MAHATSPHPAATDDGWADELALDRIGLLSRLLRLDLLVSQVVDGLARPRGLTAADYMVLGVLRLSAGRTSSPTRVAGLLGRSTGGMTQTIDRLEADGWVRREPDPTDRRRISVGLTVKGAEAAAAINTELHQWERDLDLDPSRRQEMSEMVGELLRAVERSGFGR